jgi:hypothetical protein
MLLMIEFAPKAPAVTGDSIFKRGFTTSSSVLVQQVACKLDFLAARLLVSFGERTSKAQNHF